MHFYREILSFHILSVLSWMALLFYMPRLFVYHIENIDIKEFSRIIEIQEEKIYNIIGLPSMIATIISGLTLIYLNPNLLKQNWMILKLFIIILMVLFTISLNFFRKKLKNKLCYKNGRFFRAYNEIPTLMSIYIVVLVIMKKIPIYFFIFISIIFIFIIWKILKLKDINLKN